MPSLSMGVYLSNSPWNTILITVRARHSQPEIISDDLLSTIYIPLEIPTGLLICPVLLIHRNIKKMGLTKAAQCQECHCWRARTRTRLPRKLPDWIIRIGILNKQLVWSASTTVKDYSGRKMNPKRI